MATAADIATARLFFELLERKDVESWGRLWDPDAVILVPYPAAGFPDRIEGREAIVSGFRTLMGTSSRSMRSSPACTQPRMRTSSASSTAIAL